MSVEMREGGWYVNGRGETCGPLRLDDPGSSFPWSDGSDTYSETGGTWTDMASKDDLAEGPLDPWDDRIPPEHRQPKPEERPRYVVGRRQAGGSFVAVDAIGKQSTTRCFTEIEEVERWVADMNANGGDRWAFFTKDDIPYDILTDAEVAELKRQEPTVVSHETPETRRNVNSESSVSRKINPRSSASYCLAEGIELAVDDNGAVLHVCHDRDHVAWPMDEIDTLVRAIATAIEKLPRIVEAMS